MLSTHKRSSLSALLFLLILFTSHATDAQTASPASLPTFFKQVRGNIVSYSDAAKSLQKRDLPVSSVPAQSGAGRSSTLQTMALTTSSDPEIVATARALKNNVDLIYEYVYNNIETLPFYGSLKGPLGALHDGSGTAFDQAELMFLLLQAAGYSPTYYFGTIRPTAAQLTNWLGTDTAPGSVSFALGNGGFPGTTYVNGSNVVTAADVGWAWVGVPISGTTYLFDPSTKTYDRVAGLANLGTALGYNQTNFLNDSKAGTTFTSVSVSGLNRTNLRADLATYAGNLASYIRTNNPTATTADIIGGKTIQALPLNTSLRQTSLPMTTTGVTTASSMANTYRAYLQVSIPGASGSPFTFYSQELYGHRLSVFFNGSNQPVLHYDGTPVSGGTGSAATGSPPKVTISVKISHPYAQDTPNPACGAGNFSFADQCGPLSLSADTAYVISSGWGTVGRGTIERARKLMRVNVAAQTTPDPLAEPVLGQLLSMLGLTWIGETGAAFNMADQIGKTQTFVHHAVGLAGARKNGSLIAPFVDLPYNATATSQLLARPITGTPTQLENTSYYVGAFVASAMEAGVIDQTQPSIGGVSTVKLLDIATQSGTIYDIYSINDYNNTIRPILVSTYPAGAMALIDSLVQAGYRVTLPQNGAMTVSQWTGYAFFSSGLSTSPDNSVAMSISGNLSGGLSFEEANAATAQANILNALDPSGQAAAAYLTANYGGLANNFMKGGDPVNLVTGDYLYEHEDLKHGVGEFPYSLAFLRSYDSGSRLRKGPLGLGWTHNYDITAFADSDAFTGLGDNSPVNATSAIAATYVMLDLFSPVLPWGLDRLVIVNDTARWMVDQLTGNVVNVTMPGNVEQFTKLADDTYNPPLGSASTLVKNGDGTFTYKTKDQITINFNAAGKIANWNHPSGPVVTLGYDGSNKLTSVNNGMGRALGFTYTGDNLAQVTDNVGHTVSYAYDTAGNLTTYTDALSNATTYQYDLPGRMTKIFYPTFPSNAYVTNTYDDFDRVKEQRDALNNLTQLYFAGSRAEIVNPLSFAHKYYFSSRGKTLHDINALNQRTSYEYDGQNRMTKMTVPEGNFFTYAYDTKHNLLSETHTPKPGSSQSPVTKSFTYHATYNKVATATDELGRVTTNTYDTPTGNLIGIDQPAVGGQTPHWTYAYNSLGQKTSEMDPVGKVTSYAYNTSDATLASVTEDSGPSRLNLLTQYGYDVFGNVTSVTDPKGNVSTVTYDAKRRKTAELGPAGTGAETQYVYDADDNVLQIKKATGNVSDPWQITTNTYSFSFKPKTITDHAGNVTTIAYDAADNTRYVKDAENRITRHIRDALGRIYLINNWEAPGAPTIVQYSFSANGSVYTHTDGRGKTTYFPKNGLDRLQQIVHPDGVGEWINYDAKGNVTEHFVRGARRIGYAYDALDRVITKTPDSQPAVSYTYDHVGRPLTVSDSNGTYSYTYDTAGRMVTEVSPGPRTIQYQYDANGNRTKLIWPEGYNNPVSYDALNRVTEVKEGTRLLATYTYDPLSRRTGLTYGHGFMAGYGYAANDDLTGLTQTYGSSSVTFTYGYDKTHRRKTEDVSDAAYIWHPAAAATTAYTANNINGYPTVGAASLTYDTGGNLTGDGVNTYTYDTENHLLSATTPSGTVTYTYDALGRRRTKTAVSVTTTYLSAGDREISEYTGSTLTRYVAYGPGLDEVLASVHPTTNQKTYAHMDGLGSVVATSLSGSSPAVNAIYTYGQFGETSSLSGFPYRYTGRNLDFETGLYHYRARAYSSTLGRFMQIDPLGYEPGPNLYAYVLNDPLNLTDPMGHCGTPCIVAAGIAVGHYARNILNESVTYGEARDLGWQQLTGTQDDFHTMGAGNEGNMKFASPGGFSENVFTSGGARVTDSLNMGTYNLFPADLARGSLHAVFDILPYLAFGNTPADFFTFSDRLSVARDFLLGPKDSTPFSGPSFGSMGLMGTGKRS